MTIVDAIYISIYYQIACSQDYKLWYETMATKFPGMFIRLFIGPMWSGQNKENHGYTQKVGFCFNFFFYLPDEIYLKFFQTCLS